MDRTEITLIVIDRCSLSWHTGIDSSRIVRALEIIDQQERHEVVGKLVNGIIVLLFHRVRLDCTVEGFHLVIGLRAAELRQTMMDSMVCTRLIEQMALVLWSQMLRKKRIGELGSIVGQDGGNAKRATGNQMLKERLGDGLCHPLMELGIHIFADAVDRDEQIAFLFFKAEFSDIDVHVPNRIRLESLFFHGRPFSLFRWQAIEPVLFQVPIQIRAGEGLEKEVKGLVL